MEETEIQDGLSQHFDSPPMSSDYKNYNDAESDISVGDSPGHFTNVEHREEEEGTHGFLTSNTEEHIKEVASQPSTFSTSIAEEHIEEGEAAMQGSHPFSTSTTGEHIEERGENFHVFPAFPASVAEEHIVEGKAATQEPPTLSASAIGKHIEEGGDYVHRSTAFPASTAEEHIVKGEAEMQRPPTLSTSATGEHIEEGRENVLQSFDSVTGEHIEEGGENVHGSTPFPASVAEEHTVKGEAEMQGPPTLSTSATGEHIEEGRENVLQSFDSITGEHIEEGGENVSGSFTIPASVTEENVEEGETAVQRSPTFSTSAAGGHIEEREAVVFVASTGEEPLKEGKTVEVYHDMLISNTGEENLPESMEEETEEYSPDTDDSRLRRSPVQYTDADFESVDDSESDSYKSDDVDEESISGKECVNETDGASHEGLSDNNSDENMEGSWEEVKPKQKKYRQTTLDFAGVSPSASGSSTPTTRKAVAKKNAASGSSFFLRAADRDTENYRLGYPGQEDNLRLNANLEFYQGKISSYPDGAFIDDIHNHWWGNYELLERHHGYIQWIFPIRENGMNWQAQALQLHEAEAIKADKDAHNRVLLSYEMMLDFYGMELTDRRTGQLRRHRYWRECYENLNYSSHNYLRITRILKSLGEFDFEHLKKPFLEFILAEIFQHGKLRRTMNSLKNYWIGTIKSDADREELYGLVDELS